MANYATTGITLARGDGASPEVFSTIAQVVSITGLGSGGRPEIDVTNLGSTAREFLLGLNDNGTATAELVFDPDDTQHTALEQTDLGADTARNYRVTLTNSPATTYTFAALVQRFEHSWAIDDALRATVDFRLTAKPTKA